MSIGHYVNLTSPLAGARTANQASFGGPDTPYLSKAALVRHFLRLFYDLLKADALVDRFLCVTYRRIFWDGQKTTKSIVQDKLMMTQSP